MLFRSPNAFTARVVDSTFLGDDTQLSVMADDKEPLLVCQKSASLPRSLGESAILHVYVEPDEILLLSR